MFDLFHDPLQELREFAKFHSEALQNASLLLGGEPALKCTQILLVDLTEAPSLTRRLGAKLVALHQLLTLQNTHDWESVEAAHFSNIDPASPIVEDICLLSEALMDVMYRIGDGAFMAKFEPLFAV